MREETEEIKFLERREGSKKRRSSNFDREQEMFRKTILFTYRVSISRDRDTREQRG